MSSAMIGSDARLQERVEVTGVYSWTKEHSNPRFQFEIAICPDEDGGYFVIVPELAGVVSEGDSVEEAEANVSEAIQGALIVYREHGEPIPLRREGQPELPPDCIRKWIVVNV